MCYQGNQWLKCVGLKSYLEKNMSVYTSLYCDFCDLFSKFAGVVNALCCEFLCALPVLIARWDPWPFTIASGVLHCPPLLPRAEILQDPSSLLPFIVFSSSLQTFRALISSPPSLRSRRVVNCAAAQRHSQLIRRVIGNRQGKTGQGRTGQVKAELLSLN